MSKEEGGEVNSLPSEIKGGFSLGSSKVQSGIFQLTNCASKGNWGRYSKLCLQKMWIVLKNLISEQHFWLQKFIGTDWRGENFAILLWRRINVLWKWFSNTWNSFCSDNSNFLQSDSRFPIRELQLCHLHKWSCWWNLLKSETFEPLLFCSFVFVQRSTIS